MHGFTISSGNPLRLLLLISTDTVAKGQGWGLVTGRSTQSPCSHHYTHLLQSFPCLRKTQFSI